MPYRPLVCKIRCESPNFGGSAVRNRNYALYIATRENADISDPLKEDLAADFKTTNEEYVKYISNRPRSHGLFGNVDTQDLNAIANNVANLTRSGRNIYKVIISLSELDGQLLGYTNAEKWDELLRASVPDIAKNLGVNPIDFTWVAAFHAEKGHPHVHVMLWDNKDKVRSPFIHPSIQTKCRIMLSQKVFSEEYENSLKEILKEERNQYINEKNAARENITDEFKKIFLSPPSNDVPGNNIIGLPEKLHTGELATLEREIGDLVRSLPVTGKMAYQYMPPDVKVKIDGITEKLFQRRDFAENVQSYIDASVEIQRMQGKVEKQLNAVRERAKGELLNRVGNIILKGVSAQVEALQAEQDFNEQDVTVSGMDTTEVKEKSNIPEERNIVDNEIKDSPEEPNSVDDGPEETITDYQPNNLEEDFFEIKYTYYGKEMPGQAEYEKGKAYLKVGKNYNPQKALEYFAKSAKAGNKYAMYQLGKLYMRGIGTEKDILQAQKWFLQASKEGHSWADYMLGKIYSTEEELYDIQKSIAYYKRSSMQSNSMATYQLGCIYYYGNGVDADEQKGMKYLECAAEMDNKFAECLLGDIYSNKQGRYYNFSAAIDMYKKAVLHNHEIAMFKLGKIYVQGLCGKDMVAEGEILLQTALEILEKKLKEIENEQAQDKKNNGYLEQQLAYFYASKEYKKFYDLDKAIEYHKLAVEHGKENSLCALGKIYMDREREVFNPKQAVKYFEQAIEKKNDMAMYQLGKIYLEGDIVKEDREAGISLLKKAADEYGNSYAACMLGKVYADRGQKEFNPGRAISYLKQAIEKENDMAMYRLGKIYLDGNIVMQDKARGIELLSKAADEYKNAYAACTLGKLYADQEQKEFSPGRAISYFKQAIEKENDMAMYYLGKIYLEGNITAQDNEKGIELLKKAADTYHNQYAQYWLGKVYIDMDNPELAFQYWSLSAEQGNDLAIWRVGRCYLYGIGVERDVDKGLQILKQAAEEGNEYARREIENYYNLKFKSLAYGIFRLAFFAVTKESKKEKQKADRLHYERSQQAKREAVLHKD